MQTEQSLPSSSRSRAKWILIAFLAVVGFFLFTEHKAHVLGALPYLLLFACPLMHLFMHHGHSEDRHHGEGNKR
jgi:hypothetical protein